MAKSNPLSSQFFTVRVWQEKLSEELVEVRFHVTHVLSGETRIFRKGEALLDYLKAQPENAQRD